MTAKQVSVGLTYEVLVSDKLVPVTLTKVCEWGGWYGTNLATGNAVRIKTAQRLRKQLDGETAQPEPRIEDNIIHTQTKEAAMPTTTPAQRAKRAAKRTPQTTEETTVSTTPRNANGTIKAKPKAKPAAAKKPAAKRQATIKLNANGNGAKQDAKPIVVKLKIERMTDNKVQFLYSGTAAEPFVKALWITKEALVEMGEGEITVHFGHYQPVGKQKPMPASAIRYRGATEAITDLYVNRKQAEKAGFKETSKVGMGISALTEDTIQVTLVA
jgi:hypothetical protein